MLQCIGFASWREGERERGDKEEGKRGDEGITGVLRSFDKIDMCKSTGV